jgi:branched-chain amino acid transport system substrate-binding protein
MITGLVFRFFALTVLIVVSMSGCVRGDSDETLKVGAILSLSGGAAAYGGDADKGARLAVELLRESDPNFKIDYLSQDDQSNQIEAARLARTLIDAERVHVILGPAISPSAVSVGQFADERGVAMVATSATLDAVTHTADYRRKNVFRVCFNDAFQGRALAAYAYRNLGLRRVAIIYDSTLSYSIGLAETFQSNFESLGGKIVQRENYSVNDTDYSSLVAKVARFDVEALFIPGWDENVGPMINQAAGAWNKFVLIGGDGWPTNRLLELAGQTMPETYALTHYINSDPAKTVKTFQAAYRTRYGEEATPFAALGYDALMLIADAAMRADNIDRKSIRDAIAATSNLALVTGTFSFDEAGDPRKQGIIVAVSPSGFDFKARIEP